MNIELIAAIAGSLILLSVISACVGVWIGRFWLIMTGVILAYIVLVTGLIWTLIELWKTVLL